MRWPPFCGGLPRYSLLTVAMLDARLALFDTASTSGEASYCYHINKLRWQPPPRPQHMCADKARVRTAGAARETQWRCPAARL